MVVLFHSKAATEISLPCWATATQLMMLSDFSLRPRRFSDRSHKPRAVVDYCFSHWSLYMNYVIRFSWLPVTLPQNTCQLYNELLVQVSDEFDTKDRCQPKTDFYPFEELACKCHYQHPSSSPILLFFAHPSKENKVQLKPSSTFHISNLRKHGIRN